MITKILVVDDDMDDCDLLCDALKIVNENIVCERALSGWKALNLIKGDFKPQYIFLDLNMPLFDGKKCLAEFRKMDILKDVPIIIYTTSNRQVDQDDSRNLGADYFLTKPSSLTELCGEISFVLLNRWERVTNVGKYRP